MNTCMYIEKHYHLQIVRDVIGDVERKKERKKERHMEK